MKKKEGGRKIKKMMVNLCLVLYLLHRKYHEEIIVIMLRGTRRLEACLVGRKRDVELKRKEDVKENIQEEKRKEKEDVQRKSAEDVVKTQQNYDDEYI